jgi:hypothetical protein
MTEKYGIGKAMNRVISVIDKITVEIAKETIQRLNK